MFEIDIARSYFARCRAEAEDIAAKFLQKVATGGFAAVVELLDAVPLLEGCGMWEGIVQLCEAKADALVRVKHWTVVHNMGCLHAWAMSAPRLE